MLGYGGLCYLIFLGTFVYAVGFVGNLVVPKSIDSGPQSLPAEALAIDIALLGLFAVQHSVMARPGFKRRWTRLIPPPAERSTYVLASSICLILLIWLWRPMAAIVWEVRQPATEMALWVLFGVGWLVVLVSTFLIDHFELFGLRQVYFYATGRPESSPRFHSPALYRFVRHPIMLGFLIAFWAVPVMTWGHLLFAAMTTGYIIIGVQLEEQDLRTTFAGTYEEYRQKVPMLVPWRRHAHRSNVASKVVRDGVDDSARS
jgi:protein-S-isoprenylcysteine O-methyltransferase Ste14